MQIKIYPMMIVIVTVACLCPLKVIGDMLKPVVVKWEYVGEAKYFNLYQDGAWLCRSSSGDERSMTCDSLMGEDPIDYTMTAIYPDGKEGPHSPPYTFYPPALDPYGNYVPNPDIQISTDSGTAPLPVFFDASASTDEDGVITEYKWDFGDGVIDYGEQVTHTYYSGGIFTATLTVTDDSGASASDSVVITVTEDAAGVDENEMPIAVISASSEPGTNTWKFDAYDSSDPDGIIVSYDWSFGDGMIGQGDYVEHTYDIPGTYTVTLTVTDDEGGTASSQESITIEEVPTAEEQFPISIISTGVDKQLVQVFWDYSDIGEISAYRFYQNEIPFCEAVNPETTILECLTYRENNPMTFSVTAIDNDGVESSEANTMTYTSDQPVGLEKQAPFTVYFNGSFSSDPDGEIVDYYWDFGDGEVAVAKAVEHTFTNKGVYNVFLTVTDSNGNEEESTTTVTVLGNIGPVASDSTLTLDEDQVATGSLIAADEDGDRLVYSIVDQPDKGEVTVTGLTTGEFSYAPAPDVNGEDSFTFRVNDGQEYSEAATVSITINPVNDPPIGEPLFLTTDMDSPVTGNLITSDPDGDTLQLTITENGLLGEAVITDPAGGEITYTPTGEGGGTDSLTVQVSDGEASTNLPITVEVTAVGENNPPVAVDDQILVRASLVSIDALANDTDPDGDPLTLSSATTGEHGRTEIVENQINYYPEAGFVGTDYFTYTIRDPGGATADATVNLDVDTSWLLPAQMATFNWEYDVTADVGGFRIYQDGNLICSTDDGTARSLACPITLTGDIMTFAVTAVDPNGVESEFSNDLSVNSSPIQATYKMVTYRWVYEPTAAIQGFRLYSGDNIVCEIQNPEAREMTCLIPLDSVPATFSLRAISSTGEESEQSNDLAY